MAAVAATLLVVVALLIALRFGGLRGLLAGSRRLAGVTLHDPTDDTTIDASGAVRSVQGAEIALPDDLFEELWTPASLERLARTYWAFLSSCTLGLIRVYYTDAERYVCLLFPFIRLLTFRAPEYEFDADRGVVTWRIDRGLLVAPAGRGGDGELRIEVRRLPCDEPGRRRIHVEVTVANFYPNLANRLGRWFYVNTQSRIHVIVTHGFLRRIVQRRLEESVAGRLSGPAAGG